MTHAVMLSLACMAFFLFPHSVYGQLSQRDQTVIESYYEAFGRGPTDAERKYWVDRKDWASKSALIDFHRQFLKSDSKTQNDAVAIAFKKVWDRTPNATETATWLPSAKSGSTCTEIEKKIRAAMPKNTYILLSATILPGGAKLTRHYDRASAISIDDACGSVSYHTTLVDQIRSQVAYYNSPDGTNKFLKHVMIEVYAPGVTFPSTTDEAHCKDLRNRYSTINIVKFTDDYKFQGALSHEIGHAYHNWTRCFDDAKPYGWDFSVFFEKQVAKNGTVYSKTEKPWHNPWDDPKRRDEDKFEQFANTFRYFKGSDPTRGKSGPPSPDIVVPGFNDPAANKHWGKQLTLLPELTGYWDTFGLKRNSLSWQGGEDGYWQFTNNSNATVKQTGPYEWYQYDGKKWNRVNPTYNVE